MHVKPPHKPSYTNLRLLGLPGYKEHTLGMHKVAWPIFLISSDKKYFIGVFFMDFSEAYQEFLEYVEAKGHSLLTVSSYRHDQRCFLQFLSERRITPNVEFINSQVLHM